MIYSKMPVSFQMVVTVKGLDRQNQRMRDLKKPGSMIEKEKIKGMARLEKEVEGILQNSYSKKKAEEQVICTMKVTKYIT